MKLPEFKQYRRKSISEMRQILFGEDMTGISISEPDKQLMRENPNLFQQGYVARNPKNHADLWYVAKDYFDDNLDPIDHPTRTPVEPTRLQFADQLSYRVQHFLAGMIDTDRKAFQDMLDAQRAYREAADKDGVYLLSPPIPELTRDELLNLKFGASTPVDGEIVKETEKLLLLVKKYKDTMYLEEEIAKYLTAFASRNTSASKTVYVEIASTESRPDSYEPYLIFKTEADETDFKNRYTELVCDMLLNHNGQGVFGSDKMQQIADLIHRPMVEVTEMSVEQMIAEKSGHSPITVTDDQIDAEAYYRRTTNTGYKYATDIKWFIKGAKWMRSKMGGGK